MVFDLDRGTSSIVLQRSSNDWAERRRTGTSGLRGGGGVVTFLPEKDYAMLEKVGVEIGMQTQTFTIFSINETAIIGKKAQLKICILNSVNSLNVI